MSERLVSTDASGAAATSWRVMAIDAIVVVALGTLALSPLADVFNGVGWLVAGIVGLAVGLAASLIGRILGLGPWLTAVGTTFLYLLAGLAVARGDGSIVDDVRGLLLAIVGTWRDVVTAAAPLPAHDVHQFLAMPLLTGILGGLGSGLLSWRSRWPQLAGLVIALVFVASAAFGWAATDLVALGRGLGLVVGLLLWARFRDLRGVRIAWARRILLASTVLAIALGGGAATGLAVGHLSPKRDVVREAIKPPFKIQDFPSPLSALREFWNTSASPARNRKNHQVFRVHPALAKGTYIPVATLDTFDGVVWNVTGDSGAFLQPPSPGGGSRYTVTLTERYPLHWIPAPGLAQTVRSTSDDRCPDIRMNTLTGTALDTCVPVGTRTYDEVVTPRTNPSKAQIERAVAPGTAPTSPGDTPEALAAVVDKWFDTIPSGPAGASVRALAARFRTEGRLSNGIGKGQADIRAGHSLARLNQLPYVKAQNRLVGNAEQFSSAMVIVVENKLNLPARVVFGFRTSRADGVVLGRDVTAWAEVLLDVGGHDRWVEFQPTPTKPPRVEDPNNKGKLQTILTPPNVPGDSSDDDQNVPRRGANHSGFDLWGFVLAVVGVVVAAGKTAAWLSPLWGIVLFKILRRRRRRSHEDPVTRVSGGWKEITDRARDLGTRLPTGNTRYENSVQLAEAFPDSRAASLGAVADRHVFGPVGPTEEEVQAYWADVDSTLERMRTAQPWWKRPLVWFSPLSLPWRGMSASALTWLRAAIDKAGHKLAGMAFVHKVQRRARIVSRPGRRNKRPGEGAKKKDRKNKTTGSETVAVEPTDGDE